MRRRRSSTVPKASAASPRVSSNANVRLRSPRSARPRPRIAHIVEDHKASLLDVIDNLLNKGVVLNADVILALADVDLVYVRLSALVCASDRILPRVRQR